MNYLAHLYLSGDSSELRLGNFLGDFVKGRAQYYYQGAIRQGIELHQQIDAFTDAHIVFRTSKQRISQPYRRFAGVMVDIFYDHFLAKYWSDYSPIPLAEFSRQVYDMLLSYQAILPQRLQQALPRILSQDWFMSYRDVAGIDRTFQRMSQRIKRTNNLGEGVTELMANYDDLATDFTTFFPEIVNFVRDQRITPEKE